LNQILRRQSSRSHYGSKVPAVTVTVFKYRNKIGKIVVKALYMIFICIYHPSLWTFTCFGGAPCLIVYAPESHTLSNYRVRLVSGKKKKQYHIRWRKCQKYFYVTHWQKKISLTFLTKYRNKICKIVVKAVPYSVT
jgi:hypothetical protein